MCFLNILGNRALSESRSGTVHCSVWLIWICLSQLFTLVYLFNFLIKLLSVLGKCPALIPSTNCHLWVYCYTFSFLSGQIWAGVIPAHRKMTPGLVEKCTGLCIQNTLGSSRQQSDWWTLSNPGKHFILFWVFSFFTCQKDIKLFHQNLKLPGQTYYPILQWDSTRALCRPIRSDVCFDLLLCWKSKRC